MLCLEEHVKPEQRLPGLASQYTTGLPTDELNLVSESSETTNYAAWLCNVYNFDNIISYSAEVKC